jgi:hypothetical protein
MFRFCVFMLILLAAPALTGCGLVKKRLLSRKYSPVPPSQAETFIGTVESVNPEQQFVLVRMDLRVGVAPGAKLETRSASGARGSLVVTPERKMNFLSADISGGFPERGDLVFLPAQEPQAPTVTPSTPSQPGDAPIPGVAPTDVAPTSGGALPPPLR